MARLLDGVDLLYLDEFHAHDPGDAMLLARLVRALPEQRAALVATSNHPPHGLLPDPRSHHLVLPLIAALEESCDVVELADRYATVELVGVPRLSSASADARRRFAGLVDVLCDADVRLLVEAVGPLEDVVDTDDLDHERMRSRLRLLGTAVTTT
ncbi:AFG1/ZapE family ATPase [Kineococcus arenarius]|uniref:AFG1/ZapE family ATPase n=1 Tax=unclassified Kineococcus TaxID=2621656 RepID=UPI003D7DAB49